MANTKEDCDTEQDLRELFCSLPTVPERELDPNIDPFRLEAIRVIAKQWANGTLLHYYFFNQAADGGWVGAENQQQAVRDAFQHWKDLDIGLVFEEVDRRQEAEVRIGFLLGGGSWSYVGRDVIDLVPDPNKRTMNFGWNLATPFGRDTALHEIGHTLGLKHEHQNPNSGIVWDEDAVYAYFTGPPNNWTRAQTDRNVLNKIDPRTVEGSVWDSDSIMHYSFGRGLIDLPVQFRDGLTPDPGLSDMDIEWTRRFYPPLAEEDEKTLAPFEVQRIEIDAGEQVDFHIRPTATRRYTIQTFGRSDVVMALFEARDGQPRFLAGDDDSGSDLNARLQLRLVRGREYVLRVRLYFAQVRGETAVFMW
jgi:hypothetical protein